MAKIKSKIEKPIEKAKELAKNIDNKEKEALKGAIKEIASEVKQGIEVKKATGKFEKGFIINMITLCIALLSMFYTAIQPDIVEYTDNIATEIRTEVDSVSSYWESKYDSINTELELYKNTFEIEETENGKVVKFK